MNVLVFYIHLVPLKVGLFIYENFYYSQMMNPSANKVVGDLKNYSDNFHMSNEE